MDLLNTRNKESRFLALCIELQQRFVVDNTNPTVQERQKYILPAQEAGYKIVGYFFQSKIQDAVERNAQRVGKEKIEEIGIRATRNKLEFPTFAEGFDELYYVSILPDNSFAIEKYEV
jgi:predicted kinase